MSEPRPRTVACIQYATYKTDGDGIEISIESAQLFIVSSPCFLPCTAFLRIEGQIDDRTRQGMGQKHWDETTGNITDPVLLELDFSASVDCLDAVRHCDTSWHPAHFIIHMDCGCLIPACHEAVQTRRYQFLYEVHRCVRCEHKSVVDHIEEL